MRLQLAPFQVEAFTKEVSLRGNRKAVYDDCREIVRVFIEAGHDPFTRKDIQAVLTHLGWDVWGQNAIQSITDFVNSPNILSVPDKRGYYTTPSTFRTTPKAPAPVPVSTSPTPSVAETLLAALEGTGTETEPEVTISWSHQTGHSISNKSGESLPENVGVYAEDVGLRRLAMTSTPCFSNHREGGFECSSCPLAPFCRTATLARLDEIARRLDAEVQQDLPGGARFEAKKAQLRAALTPKAPVSTDLVKDLEAKHSAEVSENMAAALAETMTTSSSSPSMDEILATIEKIVGKKVGTVPLPFEGVCSFCDKTMPEKTVTVHLPGRGIVHISCALNAVAQGKT